MMRLEPPAGFSQLITLGPVSVSHHNGFGANEPKQTSAKLTTAGQTSAATKFATLRFRNSDATRSVLCLRSAALCAVFGWAAPINAPTKPQHSLITAFTAALIHVDRPALWVTARLWVATNNNVPWPFYTLFWKNCAEKKRGKDIQPAYILNFIIYCAWPTFIGNKMKIKKLSHQKLLDFQSWQYD